MTVAAGVALPGHMLLFGRVINLFVSYSIVTASSEGMGPSIASQVQAASAAMNTSCTTDLVRNIFAANRKNIDSLLNMPGTSNDTVLLCPPPTNGTNDVFESLISFACDPAGQLRWEVAKFSLYYLGLATGVLVAVFVATVLWNISAYRQTRKMRNAFYKSILHQEIGWFDVNEANELSTRLAE